MPVYVDPMFACAPNKRWRYNEACHMYADTEPELLAMAAVIGLKYQWLQRTSLVHFDLTASRREVAIAHGAIEHTHDDLIAFMRIHSRRRQSPVPIPIPIPKAPPKTLHEELPPLEPKGTWVVKKGGNIERALEAPKINIMRPTVWGNPARIEQYGHPGAIARYVLHLCKVPTFWRRIRTQLKDQCLMCCCHVDIAPALRLREPGEAPGCHGDVLAFVADGGDPNFLVPWAKRTIEENK